jgi:hypothetical protein
LHATTRIHLVSRLSQSGKFFMWRVAKLRPMAPEVLRIFRLSI